MRITMDPDRLKEIKTFLDTCGSNLDCFFEDKDKAKQILANTSDAYNRYLIAVLEIPPIVGKKPMDPFIAGGLAQSVGGIGAGVVTALNQQEKQNQYEELQRNANESVLNANTVGSTLERQFEECEKFFLSNEAFRAKWYGIHKNIQKERNAKKRKADLSARETYERTRLAYYIFGWIFLSICVLIGPILAEVPFILLIGPALILIGEAAINRAIKLNMHPKNMSDKEPKVINFISSLTLKHSYTALGLGALCTVVGIIIKNISSYGAIYSLSTIIIIAGLGALCFGIYSYLRVK